MYCTVSEKEPLIVALIYNTLLENRGIYEEEKNTGAIYSVIVCDITDWNV